MRSRIPILACTLVAIGAPLCASSTSALADEPCPNSTLRIGLSTNLPDCRAYEQVSPSDKDGGSGGVYDFASHSQVNHNPVLPMQSLADGAAITYPGEPIFSVEGITKGTIEKEGIFSVQYTALRSSNSWSTQLGDRLSPEQTPVPVLPAVTSGTSPKVLEETPSGSKVFFLDEAELLPGTSNAAPGEPDLYEYTIPSQALPQGRLEDLTSDKNAGEHASARGVLGAGGQGAEEGSYVYFVAGGILAAHASKGGCLFNVANKTTTGTGCNLYLRHDGSTTFIVTLSPEDEGVFTLDWSLPATRTAEVSSNGHYVAFASNLALTGQAAGQPEIFRYDSQATERSEQPIVCVSCSPVGAAPAGPTLNLVSTNAQINGANRQRYMLNDGRVLFDTPNALVPQDINDQIDVYQWEPPGIGNCTTSNALFSKLSGGCAALISGGTSKVSQAVLADTSASGSDIFFTTSQSLLPQDGDTINDLYDAKEGGGFQSPPAPACPAETACPGKLPTPPTLSGAPASATFTGSEAPPPAATPVPEEHRLPPTRAQRLAKALKACHAKRDRKKRATCEASARKRYGPVRSVHKTRHRNGR